jgi:putative transposase
VSRRFIEASAAKLRELHERDLAGEDVVEVVLDGKTLAEATMGITTTGDKRFLGFVETDTENERVLTPFVRSLLERGLDLSQGVLATLDGSKGLRAAVRKAFRHRAVVHRRQWGTSPRTWSATCPRVSRSPGASASSAPTAGPSTRKPRRPLSGSIGSWRTGTNPPRAVKEGFDETLTSHRLGLYGVLGRSLKTTNCLESVNALVEERCAKVDPGRTPLNNTAG